MSEIGRLRGLGGGGGSFLEGEWGRVIVLTSSRGKCTCMRLISTMHVSWLPSHAIGHQRHDSSSPCGASNFTCAMTQGVEGHCCECAMTQGVEGHCCECAMTQGVEGH